MHRVGNQIGYKVRNIATYGQPSIEINLHGAHGTHGRYVTSYATMDTIEGTVDITVAHDTRFEDIEIAFTGAFPITSSIIYTRATPHTDTIHRLKPSLRRQDDNHTINVRSHGSLPPLSNPQATHR